MPKVGDIDLPSRDGYGPAMPPPGDYLCQCVEVKKDKSHERQTPFIFLRWNGTGGEIITDNLYVTVGTIPRLALVALRVCGMEKDHDLPEKVGARAAYLATYILKHIEGKSAVVIVDEEEYTPPGKDTITRNRVAYAGYETPQEGAPEPSKSDVEAPKDDGSFEVDDSEIPF